MTVKVSLYSPDYGIPTFVKCDMFITPVLSVKMSNIYRIGMAQEPLLLSETSYC